MRTIPPGLTARRDFQDMGAWIANVGRGGMTGPYTCLDLHGLDTGKLRKCASVFKLATVRATG